MGGGRRCGKYVHMEEHVVVSQTPSYSNPKKPLVPAEQQHLSDSSATFLAAFTNLSVGLRSGGQHPRNLLT